MGDVSEPEHLAVVAGVRQVERDQVGEVDTPELFRPALLCDLAGLLIVHVLVDVKPWRNDPVDQQQIGPLQQGPARRVEVGPGVGGLFLCYLASLSQRNEGRAGVFRRHAFVECSQGRWRSKDGQAIDLGQAAPGAGGIGSR